MKKTSLRVAGALALGLSAVPASAALVDTAVQTINFSGLTDFTQVRSVGLFDSNLGALTAVHVMDSLGITSTLTMTNLSNGPATGNARTESLLTLLVSDPHQQTVLNSLLPTLDALGSKATYALEPAGSPGDSSTGTSSGSDASGWKSTSLGSELAYFAAAGGGTFDVTGKTMTQTVITNTGGNTTANQVTNGLASFSIYYTYDDSISAAVPEPSSWGMMVLGFAMIGAAIRRPRTAPAHA